MNGTATPLLHALLEVAQRQLSRLDADLQAIGLSPALYETLVQLARAGMPKALRELAVGQRCVPSSITQKMDRLERDGLVRRLTDPRDRRVILAEITPAGRTIAAAGERIVQQVAEEFEASLNGEDRATLARVLQEAAGRPVAPRHHTTA